MRARRRERELRALLRAPEDGAHNLEVFLAAHGAELGLDRRVTRGPDEVLAPGLREHLEQRRIEERCIDQANIEAALRELRTEARWRDGHVVLPPEAFFRLTAPATRKKYIRLVAPDIDVAVRRQLLQRAGVALRAFRDVSATVDPERVRLRWSECGRLNFYAQNIEQAVDALVVSLPPRSVSTTLPTLLGEIIAELGFGA